MHDVLILEPLVSTVQAVLLSIKLCISHVFLILKYEMTVTNTNKCTYVWHKSFQD